jgi:hypothetical protein
MNPFYEEFQHLVGHGVDRDEGVGDVYKGVFYQRGYGLGFNTTDYGDVYGLGFADNLMSMFRFALPVLKTGLQYLGKQAVSTAANIAQDAIEGRNMKDAAKEHLTNSAQNIFAKAPEMLRDQFINTTNKKRKGVSADESGEGSRPKKKSRVILSNRQRPQQRKIGRGLLSTYPYLEKIF